MKINLLFLIILSHLTISAQAKPKPVVKQPAAKITPPKETANDPEAEKYLKLLKTKIETLSNFKLSYKLAITDVNNTTTTQTGTYIGSKEKFVSETNQVKTINDGKTQWVIASEDKEIQITSVKAGKGKKVETPLDVIKKYNTLFKYRVKEPLSNNIIVLELIPLEKNSSYFKIDLSIQTKTNQMVSSKLYDRGGNRLTFTFTKQEENLKLTPDFFSCKPENYKDYEILDMR